MTTQNKIQAKNNTSTLVGTNPLIENIRLTKWTANHPVTKELSLQDDGTIKKISTASQLYEGTITKIECTPMEFVEVLMNIGPNDSLSYAQPKDESAVRIMSRKKYAAKGNPEYATTRTIDEMVWPKGPAILMGDHDPQSDCLYSPEQLREALYKCCPSMRNVAHIWVPSTSSCLINSETGAEIRGISGQRLYLIVAHGTDIPRAGAVICKRAWLEGHGYIKISKAGRLLVRSILDEAVFQTNRIDYCAPPVCVPPLISNKPNPTLFGNANLALDTKIALPDLTKEELVEYERLVLEAKVACKIKADDIRVEYKKAMVNKHITNGLSQEGAELVVAKALDNNVLLADFVLISEDGQEVRVAELLANKQQWQGKRFADPIEPDYHNDNRVARSYLLGHLPYLHSFAHGGQRYKLSHNYQSIRLVQGERANYMNEISDKFNIVGQFYRRDTQLVSIAEDGKVVSQSCYQILAAMDQQFRFEKFKGKSFIAADAPLEIAKMFADAYVDRFPKLKAVLTAPCIEPVTGRLLTEAGYDSATQAYIMVTTTGQGVPECPTTEQVGDAVSLLWCPVKLFPFATPVDETVMLTAMLTAVIRPLLPTAPAFGFDAPIQASGKTLLIKVLSALGGNIPIISPQSDAKNDEEMRKRLFAHLRAGHSNIVIDNIIGEFDSASLAAMLTSEVYSDRILSQSKTETAQTNAMVMLSGNNLILKGDLPRRILRCRIDPNSELPHQREFNFDPVEMVQEGRQDMVIAALTLFKGYLAAKNTSRFGPGRTASFEVWDDLVRQTICWLASQQKSGILPIGKEADDVSYPTLTDPLDAINDAVKEDPARTILGRLLNAWALEIGTGNSRDTAVIVKSLIVKANLHPYNPTTLNDEAESQTLKDILVEMAGSYGASGEIRSANLGKSLAKNVDRITNGLCLRKGDLRQGAHTWWVEDMNGGVGGVGGVGEDISILANQNSIKHSISTKEKHLTTLTNLTKKSINNRYF